MIAVTPSGSLTTNVQTSLQALDAGKAATSHTHPSSALSDSTAAGRALLTAADATAQNALLGTASLGFVSGNIKETAGILLETGWYWCDGSNKNRVTDVNLFNAITIQQNGVLNSTAVVTGLSDTSNMSPGMPLSGTGIQAGTVIQSVDSSTQITMSLVATASATTRLVFAPYGVGDGATTFGIPNRSYIAVGRDNASGSASNVLQVSTTVSITTGTNAATVASATGLFVGMFVNQPKIPIGTKITAISGTSVTFSNNATGTLASAAVRFSPVLDAQTLGAVGGGLTSTVVTANLPAYIPTGSVAVANGTNVARDPGGLGTITHTSSTPTGLIISLSGFVSTIAAAFTGTAQGGTSVPLRTTQPTIVMNFIIKR